MTLINLIVNGPQISIAVRTEILDNATKEFMNNPMQLLLILAAV